MDPQVLLAQQELMVQQVPLELPEPTEQLVFKEAQALQVLLA
jgi:hypothetical protein